MLGEGLYSGMAFVTGMIGCTLIILYYLRKDNLRREYEE